MSNIDLQSPAVETAGANLNVADVGHDMPALVFLHYWGGSSRTWTPVIERLAPSARCVAIDQRGWGRSSAPDDAYRIADLADDAMTVIDRLKLTDYILVGHSMGGKVSQVIAGRGPRGLRGVVLVAPAPAKPAPIPDFALDQMAHAYETRESVVEVLDNVLRHRPLSEDLREQVIEDSLAGSPQAKRAWPTQVISEDVSAHLGEIAVPVLVVAGDHDQVEPVDLMRSNVIAEIPGARLSVIADTGHLIPLEQPEELADLIEEFRAAVVCA